MRRKSVTAAGYAAGYGSRREGEKGEKGQKGGALALREIMGRCDDAVGWGRGGGEEGRGPAGELLFFDSTAKGASLSSSLSASRLAELAAEAKKTEERALARMEEEDDDVEILAARERKGKREEASRLAPETPYWKDTDKYSRGDEERLLALHVSTIALAKLVAAKARKDAEKAAKKKQEAEEAAEAIAAAAAALRDPKAMLVKKAKAGWSSIRVVATLRLTADEKDAAGIKKMMRGAVRAMNMNETTDPRAESGPPPAGLVLTKEEEMKEEEALLERERNDNRRRWKIRVPNARHFKAAAACDNDRSEFASFAKVLAVDSSSLKGTAVQPAEVMRESLLRLEEAASLFSEKAATKARADVLRSIGAVGKEGGGGKRLSDLEEWQIYHVDKCLKERSEGRSLPNLRGESGKFKIGTRKPPEMLML